VPDLKTAAGQFELLTDGCIDVVRPDELKARLERSLATGRPLVVKVGFDPSSPDIHLGHVVLIRKMKQFQDCGHALVFVVGDFTAMIGDPTGRSKTRPQLSREEIAANARTYRAQAAKILDDAKTSFRNNSEWLEALGSVGLIRLAAKYNVARMLERRDFKQRYESGQPIAVHEFLYPLAQAYDSVALEADVELGGTDQLFNLNVGRDIMPEFGLAPQVVLTTPLLEGLDGVEKMSKSLGNYVAIEDPPREMFGKLMSVSDELMWKYWKLLSGLPSDWIELAEAGVKVGFADIEEPVAEQWQGLVAGLSWDQKKLHAVCEELVRSWHDRIAAREGSQYAETQRRRTDFRERAVMTALADLIGTTGKHEGLFHPKAVKMALAHRIVADFHGPAAAAEAEEEFRRVFSSGQNPSEIEEAVRPLSAEGVWLPKLLSELRLVKSNGEAIRLIQQGGVEVDGNRVESKDHRLEASAPAAYLVKVGKRRYVRVRFE
jgi:tyrosyl-tRNA synthetase